jgi:hypothetical protein
LEPTLLTHESILPMRYQKRSVWQERRFDSVQGVRIKYQPFISSRQFSPLVDTSAV